MARYRIVPDRSSVWIHARSTLHAIDTKTDGLEGWVDLEGDGDRVAFARPPAAHLELAVERLRSGNPLQDRELRRRINARAHPTITGDLTAVDSSNVSGDVTFMGTRRSYTSPLSITRAGSEVHVTGEATFDVRDFGLQPPRILVLQVEPEVTVRIDVVAAPD